MSDNRANEIKVLRLTLHDRVVGYLAGFHNGRNVLSFSDSFKGDAGRPAFSLITSPRFPRADRLMAKPWVKEPTASSYLIQSAT